MPLISTDPLAEKKQVLEKSYKLSGSALNFLHGKSSDCKQNNKKMKPFQAYPTQSGASLVFSRERPFSALSISAQNRSFGNPSCLSVGSICRILKPVKIDNFIFAAMTNAHMGRFFCIHHTAARPLSRGRRYGGGYLQTLSTCSTALTSLIIRPPSLLTLSACITQSDAPQRSEEWFQLRKDKLTTSTFSTALGFWKGTRRLELWQEKVFASETQIIKAAAMEWGVLNEAAAIDNYKSITSREVSHLGFAIHSAQQFDWLGASPDGLLGYFPGGGILEVKCPFNKGKPEVGLPWKSMPFYYMPQVQGQLEIMNREWADLYCWTPNGSTIFRVHRDRGYWELIHGILREFWWENVVPAREALLLEGEEKAKSYMPTPTHRLTGLIIFKSSKLASESKMLCREIAGHVEFFRS